MRENLKNTKKFLLWFIFSVLICTLHLNAQTPLSGSIWKDINLYSVPSFRMLSKDSVVGLIYEGGKYRGHKQGVFAYYATPGTLYGNKALDKNLPAIILVHGGGGQAFKDWAIKWAKKGYAAIALDLRGNGPDKRHLINGFTEPGNQTPYFDVNLPLKDQWMYQAVANVLLANSLIRSFKGIDTSRTAITGISWGGVITCIVAALDPRYKAAVPVYGCGYLGESGRMKAQLNDIPKENKNIWLTQYDPSQYLSAVKMPMLFLNDATDPYFELSSFMKSYNLVTTKKRLCIKINLKHSHRAGWSNKEIYSFINHHLRGTPGLPEVSPVIKSGNAIICKLKNPAVAKEVILNYSTDTVNSGTKRKWTTVTVKPDNKNHYSSKIPDGANIWYFSVENFQGLISCSSVGFSPLSNKTIIP